jgi:TonB family protein
MKIRGALFGVAALAALGMGAAGAQPATAPALVGAQMHHEVRADSPGIDLLSDTQGVDFQPYLSRILKQIHGQWVKLLPDESRSPLCKNGATLIRLTIQSDGTLTAMHLERSAQDHALDRAAWGSITGVGEFPPLPKGFHGQNLELRVHFRVNG